MPTKNNLITKLKGDKIIMKNNIINETIIKEMNEEMPPIQLVKSIRIAESLCADYPFFKDLLSIRKDKFNEKRKVWFFRRSEEFDDAFDLLVNIAKENKFRKDERM